MNLCVDRLQPSLLIIKRIQGITSRKAPNSYIAKEHESHLSSSVFYENVDFTHHRYLAVSWGCYMLQFWSLQGSLYGRCDSNNTDIDFYWFLFLFWTKQHPIFYNLECASSPWKHRSVYLFSINQCCLPG